MSDNFSKFSLALPFTLVVSACYLYGYWYTFDIDFYSYISVSEIAITSIIPLMFVGILTILGIALGQWSSERKEKQKLDPPEKQKRSKYIQRFFDIAFFIGAVLTIFFGGSNKWLIIPSIVAIPLAIGIIKAEFVNKEVIKANLSLMFLIVYLSTQSFGYGKMKAQKIIEGTDFRYIMSSVDHCDPLIDQNKRYIGKIGEYVFIYLAKEKSVLVNHFNENLPLLLKEYDRSATCLTKT